MTNEKKSPVAADYNADYYMNCCGVKDYVHNQGMITLFRNIAKILVHQFHPGTVLDAGCACGHLVAALHELGVDAWGVDISEYAISQVRPDVKEKCFQGSLTDLPLPQLPRRFDLVTNIEILEHMPAEDAKRSIRAMCQLSDTILFSSTPLDKEEKTHVNVQPLEYWAELFAGEGFFPDFTIAGKVFNVQSLVFRKGFPAREMIRTMCRRHWEGILDNTRLAERIVQVANEHPSYSFKK